VDLNNPCLMLVTDRHRCRPGRLLDAVEAAVAAGVDAVQLREKDLDAAALYDLTRTLRGFTRGRCPLIVNGRLDVALAANADGVHLPENGLPLSAARPLCPEGFLLGRSVHSVAGAVEAQTNGASYVQLGTIFETASKPGVEPAGLALVHSTAAAVTIPCLAVGGVGIDNARDVIAAGATGIAVVSAILLAADIQVAVQQLRAAITAAPAVRGT
jgi:thiamine-phosphate diphosphorylase